MLIYVLLLCDAIEVLSYSHDASDHLKVVLCILLDTSDSFGVSRKHAIYVAV